MRRSFSLGTSLALQRLVKLALVVPKALWHTSYWHNSSMAGSCYPADSSYEVLVCPIACCNWTEGYWVLIIHLQKNFIPHVNLRPEFEQAIVQAMRDCRKLPISNLRFCISRFGTNKIYITVSFNIYLQHRLLTNDAWIKSSLDSSGGLCTWDEDSMPIQHVKHHVDTGYGEPHNP